MTADGPAGTVRWVDPEEQQLTEQLTEAETALVDAEVAVETLRVELDNFAHLHHQRLGPMYVRLDELDALIAEAVAARTGDPEDIRRAVQARSVLDPELEQLVAEAEGGAESEQVPQAPERIRPDRESQRLYRELARQAHPDLAQEPEEVERRSAFIARVNAAYARGDLGALQRLADEWTAGGSAASAPEPGSAERAEWLRRRLERLSERLRRLEALRAELTESPMGQLLMLLPEDPDALLEALAEQLLATVAEREAELARVLAGA